jgi:hypothetical protein
VVGPTVIVALEDPRRGFVIADIERATGHRVSPIFAGISTEEILEIINNA